MVGLEKTACLIGRCTVYEFLYLNIQTAVSEGLAKSIFCLYTAILKYLAGAIARSKGECSRPQGCTTVNSFSDNPIDAAFTTREISNYLQEIEGLEETVGQDAAVAEAECMIQGYCKKYSILTPYSYPGSVPGLSNPAAGSGHDRSKPRKH